MNQLKDSRISLAVKQLRPADIREAVSVTVELQSYLHVTTESHSVYDNYHLDVTTVESTQTAMLKIMEKLIDRVEQLEASSQQQHNDMLRKQPVSSCQQIRNEVVCRKCGKIGHYARGCAMSNTPRKTNQDQRNLECASTQEHN